VLVTGFSQGASAAIGLARALQDGADPWFRLAALAPISGAYDLRYAELPALSDGTVKAPWNVGYISYHFVSWNRLHHLYDRPDEVFAKKYAGQVEQLFDGVHTGEDLAGALPDSVDKLLTPHGVDLITNPSGPFAEALRVHDSTCQNWAPRVAVRLYISAGDEQAPVANSAHCHDWFGARGVDAPVVAVADFEYNGSVHLGSNIVATAATVEWFSSLR
jgi:hypothetical protein